MPYHTDIAIVGAGFSGLGAAIRLKLEAKKTFLVIERAEQVGGTWRENTYPGCACDIPSNLYSFSFEQNPNWSRIFPRQQEIFTYLEKCVQKYHLDDHMLYNTEISREWFDEEKAKWIVMAGNEVICECRILVSATGPLNKPVIPDIPGLHDFEGTYWHSSQWDHSCDITGKKVAIIGTGASAIQVVPSIQAKVSEMILYQRNPPWIIPRPDRQVSGVEHFLFRHFPAFQRLRRWWLYLILEIRVGSFLGKNWLNRLSERQALDHIRDQIKDKHLQKQVTPAYKIGCKRILVSNDYYPALQKDNVSLITAPITKITKKGLLTDDGLIQEVDHIIFCTGFQASELMQEIEVLGLKGASLASEWAENGPEAYYGMTVSNFPNLLLMVGPNTGLGHNSLIFMIEAQVNYLMDYIKTIDRLDIKYLDVKMRAQRKFNLEIQRKMTSTVWYSGCNSWYLTSKGKNTTLWPGSTISYYQRTKRVDLNDYTLFFD